MNDWGSGISVVDCRKSLNHRENDGARKLMCIYCFDVVFIIEADFQLAIVRIKRRPRIPVDGRVNDAVDVPGATKGRVQTRRVDKETVDGFTERRLPFPGKAEPVDCVQLERNGEHVARFDECLVVRNQLWIEVHPERQALGVRFLAVVVAAQFWVAFNVGFDEQFGERRLRVVAANVGAKLTMKRGG